MANLNKSIDKLIGKEIPKGPDANLSWSAYWAAQADVLFFAETKNIADGKLYNQKTGSSDYLTVTGASGSYTFQCPDTAPYIAADTDRIWFDSDVLIRTALETELIAYDFTRTIVKYDDSSPYTIRAIMILSSDVDTFKMRTDFYLSLWWDNTLSLYGRLKGNRESEQSVWVNPMTVLTDGDTKQLLDSQDLDTITKDSGTGEVSSWKDKLLSGNDLTDPGATKRPVWSTDGILFDGSNDYMTSLFTWNAPQFIYLVFKHVTWNNGDYVFDGGAASSAQLQAYSTSPKMLIRGMIIEDVPLDTWVILRVQLKNGANKAIVNNGTPVTSTNAGVNLTGFTLGGRGISGLLNGNIQVKEVITRGVDETSDDETIVYNYLASKYGFDTI